MLNLFYLEEPSLRSLLVDFNQLDSKCRVFIKIIPTRKYYLKQLFYDGQQILKWLNYSTTFSTQFVLVLFTFDRLLAVTYPLKYRLLKHNLKYPVISCSAGKQKNILSKNIRTVEFCYTNVMQILPASFQYVKLSYCNSLQLTFS